MGKRGQKITKFIDLVQESPGLIASQFPGGFLVGCRELAGDGSELRDTAEMPLSDFDDVTEVKPENELDEVLPAGADAESYFAYGLQPASWADGKCSVGRSASCDLIIQDRSVSRHHANLECDFQGRLMVSDHESTNGTTVSRIPVHLGESKVIDPGKTVQFGEAIFTLMRPEQFADFVRLLTGTGSPLSPP